MENRSENKPCIVYILQSQTEPGQFYTGMTSNISKRIIDHNSGKSSHTSKFRPWILIHYAWFKDQTKASEYEKYLKSGSGRAFASKHLR